jgi:KaiC/GvpD/RAD55 family RecA-like ATPase
MHPFDKLARGEKDCNRSLQLLAAACVSPEFAKLVERRMLYDDIHRAAYSVIRSEGSAMSPIHVGDGVVELLNEPDRNNEVASFAEELDSFIPFATNADGSFREREAMSRLTDARRQIGKEIAQERLASLLDEVKDGRIQPSELPAEFDAIVTSTALANPTPRKTLADLACPLDGANRTIVRTGIHWWDDLFVERGLRPSDKVLIGGDPGMGKTSLTLNLAHGLLVTNPDAVVVWAHAEMAAQDLFERLCMIVTELPLTKLTCPMDLLSTDEQAARSRGVAEAMRLASRIVPLGSPVTTTQLVDAASRLKPTLIVVDYVQLIRPAREYATRLEAIEAIAADVPAMAKYGSIVVLLSAVNKRQSGESIALHNAAKGSSELLHLPDVIVTLSRRSGSDNEVADGGRRFVQVCVEKNRRGPAGHDIQLVFDGPTQRFGLPSEEPREDIA